MSLSVETVVDKGGFRLEVAFDIPASGFTAVAGPSGCGKTTLLRTIAGLEPEARGHITIGGECWLGERCRLPTHRRAVGYVFQQAALLAHLDVRGNLLFGRRRAAQRPLAFDDVVDLLGLSRLLGRAVAGLSGGERQRVAIAQALLSSPSLLLMDEPMAALDRASRDILLPYLEALQRALDIPVLYVTHALDEVARLADHLLWIQDGRIAASGAVNELLTRLDLPLAHGREAGAVIRAQVAEQDPVDRMTRVDFSGGQLWIPRVELPLDTSVAPARQNGIIGGATLWVLAGKDAAEYKGLAKFLTYLSSPEVQAWWHQETGYVPITKAAYELSKTQGFYDANPGTDTAITQLSLNEPTPNSRGIRFGNFVQVRDVINEELEAPWAGQKTAKEAMDEAVERGNALLRKFERSVD